MNKEEELQAEVSRLTQELEKAKKYIVDINKYWKFKVERLEILNNTLLKSTQEPLK